MNSFQRNWWPWGVLTILSLVILFFFVLYPLGVLFGNSIRDESGALSLIGFSQLLADSQYLAALRNTLVLGVSVTFLATLIGVPLAYMVARTNSR